MFKKLLCSLVLGGSIRYLLSISKYAKAIENRVEISTPLNSFKRLQEGVYLFNSSVDPYQGDVFHESPIILLMAQFMFQEFSSLVLMIFILMDLMTAVILYFAAKGVTMKNWDKQKTKEHYAPMTIAPNTKIIQMIGKDCDTIPFYCALAYLFNPYSILNCVAKTSTVFSNFLLSLVLLEMNINMPLVGLLALVVESVKNFYPMILIVPFALNYAEGSGKRFYGTLAKIIIAFFGWLAFFQYNLFKEMGNWKFLDSTFGFIIHCRDLTPNIGLFWYFFTEMFDHFRELFLYTFQLNTTLLYLLPLTFTFKDNPNFLFTVLFGLTTIFRSYPCVGDIAFYMALIPLWKYVTPFMSHNFIVIATFLVTSILGPTVYHLWMFAGSANANFYFGVTLVFCTANIFLLTDLTFAYLKREFCLKNGLSFDKKMKLSLE